MIWSYAKPFNEKMRDNRFFNTFNQWYKNRKNTNLSCWYKNTQQKPKPNNVYKAGLKACNFIEKRLQHRCFSVKFPKFLRTPFLKEHL